MENMTAFFTEMLQAVAVFLGTEPIIYIFGLVCLPRHSILPSYKFLPTAPGRGRSPL